jgi:hypothetical protein
MTTTWRPSDVVTRPDALGREVHLTGDLTVGEHGVFLADDHAKLRVIDHGVHISGEACLRGVLVRCRLGKLLEDTVIERIHAIAGFVEEAPPPIAGGTVARKRRRQGA